MRRRRFLLQVRLSERERALLRDVAEREQVSVSEALRLVLRGQERERAMRRAGVVEESR
jgi:hypothetical protein